MNSELEVLKRIWENKGENSIRALSRQTDFGIDYIRYICDCLSAKEQIKSVKGKRDWYKITSQGKRTLEMHGVIKLKASKKESDVEKVIWYLPKKLESKALKSKSQEISIEKTEGKSIKAEEKKLDLGRNIAKAVKGLVQKFEL